MDLQKFLRAVEDFIYEIALWPALIVKTLIQFTLRPERVHQYVEVELAKAEDVRYDEYMSPVLFWLLIGFAPYFGAAELYAKRRPDLKDFYFKASFEYRFAAILIFGLFPPLTYALGTLIVKREKITRHSLRRPLYVQFLAQAPFFLGYLLLVSWALGQHILPAPVHTKISIHSLIWFSIFTVVYTLFLTAAVYVQAVLLKLETVLTWWGAIWRVLVIWMCCLAVALPLESLAFAVLAEATLSGK